MRLIVALPDVFCKESCQFNGCCSAASGIVLQLLCVNFSNAAGRKFLVYAFVARDSLQTGAISGIMRGWCRAAQLRSQLAWLAGRTPDAICNAAPDLYMLVKKDADSLTVGLWNFGVDTVFAPVVHLGENWAALEPGAGSAALEGRTVTLGELPAFGFASFTLHK